MHGAIVCANSIEAYQTRSTPQFWLAPLSIVIGLRWRALVGKRVAHGIQFQGSWSYLMAFVKTTYPAANNHRLSSPAVARAV
jgi:hypothetical protein